MRDSQMHMNQRKDMTFNILTNIYLTQIEDSSRNHRKSNLITSKLIMRVVTIMIFCHIKLQLLNTEKVQYKLELEQIRKEVIKARRQLRLKIKQRMTIFKQITLNFQKPVKSF